MKEREKGGGGGGGGGEAERNAVKYLRRFAALNLEEVSLFIEAPTHFFIFSI